MACRVPKNQLSRLWRLRTASRSCRCHESQSRSFSSSFACLQFTVNQPHSSIKTFSSSAATGMNPSKTSSKNDFKHHQHPLDVLRQLDMDPDALYALASQNPTPLSLADMYKYASSVSKDQRLYNAQFLHKELAIRIAQRAVDLLTLPLGLSQAEPIRQVARLYLHYIKQLQETPAPTTSEQEDKFTQLLQSFVLDRTTIPTQIARGVREWNRHTGTDGRTSYNNNQHNEKERQDVLEEVLYRFFTARVGLRFLIEHHVVSSTTTTGIDYRKHLGSVFPNMSLSQSIPASLAASNESAQDADISSGCIQSNVNVVQETRMVAEMVKDQTTRTFGICPDIHIVDCIHSQQESVSNNNRAFTYVPHHLHYMLAELLMNACRATVRQYQRADAKMVTYTTANNDGQSKISATSRANQQDETPALLPIRVVLVMGKEDITIKVCDKGGGIPRSLMGKIWKFGHSTDTGDDVIVSLTSGGETEEIAGSHIRGFGLPLARIYARYFGGELNLKSLEGHGVDAYLHLPRLGQACEHLPMRVRSSPGELDSIPREYR